MLALIWAAVSALFFVLLSYLPSQLVEGVNSWNIFGDNPAWAAIYWEGTALAYAAVYAVCVITHRRMNISLVDFTIWLLGLLIAPVLLHFISPAPGSVGYMVCLYVVPLAFCVIAHYLTLPLRRRMKERDAAIGKEAEND